MLRNQPYAFTVSLQDAYSVVRAEGELDIASVAALGAAVNDARGHAPRVIVDLRAVTFMDTFALRALITFQRSSSARPRCSLHVVPGPAMQRVLDVTGARTALRWMSAEQLAA
jgi:anti-anti-sigma factor